MLWAGTSSEFRTTWGHLLECLTFRYDDYSPYGIRRGGATWHFLETGSLDATLARGRWSVSKVARQYIDDGTLTLAQLQMSREQKRQIKLWLRRNRAQWQD